MFKTTSDHADLRWFSTFKSNELYLDRMKWHSLKCFARLTRIGLSSYQSASEQSGSVFTDGTLGSEENIFECTLKQFLVNSELFPYSESFRWLAIIRKSPVSVIKSLLTWYIILDLGASVAPVERFRFPSFLFSLKVKTCNCQFKLCFITFFQWLLKSLSTGLCRKDLAEMFSFILC